MKNKIDIRFIVLITTTLLVGFWRIMITGSHTPMSNFTPIGAMALFGGAYFVDKKSAYLFPLLTLFISDVILMQTIYVEYNEGLMYRGWYWVYLAFGLMVGIGNTVIKKVSFKNVILGAFLAGLVHFIMTNFGVWLSGGLDITTGLPYTRNFAGVIKCYALALPFFKYMVAGNLMYSALLFGGFELAKTRFRELATSSAM